MPQDDNISKAGECTNGILQTLALLHARVLAVHHEDRSSKTQHGRLEGAAGARAWLKERGGEDFVLQSAVPALTSHQRPHLVGAPHKVLEERSSDLANRRDVLKLPLTHSDVARGASGQRGCNGGGERGPLSCPGDGG